MNETVVRIGDAVWLGVGGTAVILTVVLVLGLAWDGLRRRRARAQDEPDSR